MLTPQYLQSVPDAMVELYAKVEMDILADMARRISAYDLFIPAAQHQLKKLEEMGAVRAEIMGQLLHLTGKSGKELEQIMTDAGMTAVMADDMIYRAVGLKPSPLSASPAMQKILAVGIQKTGGLFENLTKTTASTATKQFEGALDSAYMMVTSGAFSPGVAVQSAIKRLAKEGVAAIEYPPKVPGGPHHTDNMDVAVRRAVITGVNQTCGKLQEARADEMGVDLVETTAHAGARPSHALWQGKVFSRSGKSTKYPDFRSSTGYGTGAGLMGRNCSHSFFPYIEGMPRAHSKELLQSYEAKRYTYNGLEMTEYEALQQQRAIERNLRRWKREHIAMQAAGLDTAQSAGKIKLWQDTQKDFIRQTGLKRQAEREQVPGWGRSEAARTSAAQKNVEIKRWHDTMLKKNRTSGETAVHNITRLDIAKYRCVSEHITTDEVIITPERILHIKERHPNDFERYEKYLKAVVDQPDFILASKLPHTAFVLKEVKEADEKFQLILRLKVNGDPEDYKNSIITFLKVSEKKWKKYLRNKKILYKRE